ncbi:maleylacetoacetate isomerase [Ditylenchus destructor]|uniref:maleylacetoacetate isomerase n=1 Tax=Ditylenchus destructor TaxID=166010 RepID=A0AAD4R4P4_9BILA|nr:maleylacetoacetate isomerase [Ditylenchus destructor]
MSDDRPLPILYNYWWSSCAWRVRIALNLKKIDYEYRPVDMDNSQQKSAEFLKINPRGLVPALVHNGKIFTESMAIVEYLEEKFADAKPKLLPENPDDRVAVRALAFQIACNIQPLQNTGVLAYLREENDLTKADEFAVHWIERGFAALEEMLSKTAGKFCYGDEISLADICIPPQVFNATRRFGINMNKFPRIKRINETLSQLPEFHKAHPAQQIDAPADVSRYLDSIGIVVKQR